MQRIREALEESGELDRERWDYVQDAPKSLLTPYTAFGRFREEVAAVVGIDLSKMWGFGPENDFEAYRRLHPGVKPGAIASGAEVGAKEQWFAEEVIQWEEVNTPLEPFLHHSDCEGELTPDECRLIADPLRDAVGRLAHRLPEEARWGERFLEIVDYCAANDCHLLFR